jgi:hypothetical protein
VGQATLLNSFFFYLHSCWSLMVPSFLKIKDVLGAGGSPL